MDRFHDAFDFTCKYVFTRDPIKISLLFRFCIICVFVLFYFFFLFSLLPSPSSLVPLLPFLPFLPLFPLLPPLPPLLLLPLLPLRSLSSFLLPPSFLLSPLSFLTSPSTFCFSLRSSRSSSRRSSFLTSTRLASFHFWSFSHMFSSLSLFFPSALLLFFSFPFHFLPLLVLICLSSLPEIELIPHTSLNLSLLRELVFVWSASVCRCDFRLFISIFLHKLNLRCRPFVPYSV